MRGPSPPTIDLSTVERQALEARTRRHAARHQLALRARIGLAAAAGATTGQRARHLALRVKLVRR